jgi:hyperosmotically inducible protein
MKKLIFVTFLFLAVSALVLTAQPRRAQEQAVQTAAPLETAVRDAIRLEPHYGVFDNLSFRLDGSDVTLLGQVLLPITRDETARRVAKLEGVGQVTNQIEVLPMSQSDDAIRLRVYRNIFGTSDLYRYALGPDPSLHIIVKGGHVTLEGVVANEGDGRMATMAARKVGGTFSVTNNLKSEK